MKVQCDVCEETQATVLCCADDAALCKVCDSEVHAANKLAGKHQRVPLIYPSSPDDELPLCDICQEKIGHFFCLEDRAVLCQSCDFSIHSRNILAAKHKRFLLCGIRLDLQVITTESIQNPSSGFEQASPTTTPSQSSSPRVMTSTPSRTIVQDPSMKSSGLKGSHCHCKKEEDINGEGQDFLSSRIGQPPAKKPNNGIAAFSPSVVPFSPSLISSPPGNQQLYFNSTPSQTDWDILDMIQMQYNGPSVNGASRGGGFLRRNSASEYMNETIPSWKVDELLGFPDVATMRGAPELGSSKAETSTSSGHVDGHIKCDAFEESMAEEMVTEVPLVPSPPTTSGLPRPLKSSKQLDLVFSQACENPLVVPNIGGIFSPPVSPRSLH